MKYPVTQYNELKSALLLFIERYKIDKETATSKADYLHYKIYQQKTYQDSNANIIKNEDGSRLFELNEAFSLYPEGCNDTHVKTAMKNVINEIFN
jgi:hypothetical protein